VTSPLRARSASCRRERRHTQHISCRVANFGDLVPRLLLTFVVPVGSEGTSDLVRIANFGLGQGHDEGHEILIENRR
jgi:hypothetical protein